MKKKMTRMLSFLASAGLIVGMMPMAAFAETEDQLSDQPHALQETTMTTEVQTMENDVFYDVTLKRDEYWVGKFTAPSDGRYDFFSDRTNDISKGELYLNPELTVPAETNDEGGLQFHLVANLTADQTVYLKVNELNENELNCAVKVLKFDEKNLYYGQLDVDEPEFLQTGSPIEVKTEVKDYQGTKLTEGTDYEIVYVSGDEESLTPPTEVGVYYVYARAISNQYTGATAMKMVRVHDEMDINSEGWYDYDWEMESNTVDYTGEPVVLPELMIRHYDDETATATYLKENEAFKLDHFEDYSGKVLKSAPSKIAGYFAVYVGISPYKGEYRKHFLIWGDGYDLEQATVYIGNNGDENRMDHTGKTAVEALDIDVASINGGTLDADESYDLIFYDSTGKELSAAPSERGTYYVSARAKADTDYRGETPKKKFYICDENDLGNSRFYRAGSNSQREYYAYTGEAVEYVPDREFCYEGESDYVHLVSGTDFAFDHIEDDKGNVIDAPKEIGDYYAVYRGCGAYSGYRDCIFKVVDQYDMTYVDIGFGDEFTGWLIDGKVDLPVIVTDVCGNVLTPETDYKLEIVKETDSDYTVVDEITEAGNYYVCTSTGSNEKYQGESRTHLWFDVTDRIDITNWDGSFTPSAEVLAGSDTLPQPEISFQAGDVKLQLVENKDYELSYISAYGDTTVQYGKNVPDQEGQYQAVYIGRGDPYFGEIAIPFYVVEEIADLSDLANYYAEYSKRAIDLGDALPTPVVFRYNGNDTVTLTEGTDYELDHFQDMQGDDYGASMPKKADFYHVYYRGIGDYKGLLYIGIRIYDTKDISTWEGSFLNDPDSAGYPVIEAGSSLVPRIYRKYGYDDTETVELTEGVNYELDHFEDEAGNDLGHELPDIDGYYIACYTAKGDLVGTKQIRFQLVGCEPKNIKNAEVKLGGTGYTYDGKVKTPGVESVIVDGKVLVAGTDYKVTEPAGRKDAGTYTYTITGTGHYKGTVQAKFVIAKADSSIQLEAQSKVYTRRALSYSGKVTKAGSTGKVTYTYYSDSKGTKVVNSENVKAAKVYYVKATLAGDTNHKAATSKVVKFTISKAGNPMKVKAKKRTIKYSKVSKKAQAVSCITVSKSQGKKTFKLVSVKKTKFKKYFAVNTKTGKLTVKKGVPKGTYIVVVSVKAAGNANYKALTKKVKCTIVVK